MTLGEMFTNTYSELHLVAKRITQRRDVTQAKDLISYTYLTLHQKQYPEQRIEFIKWFSKSMSNIYKWPNSSFNKDNSNIGEELIDTPQPEETETRYNSLMLFKKTLPLHEQLLFELYYEKELSAQKIADLLNEEPGYDMSKDRILEMINTIKKKIKAIKWT